MRVRNVITVLFASAAFLVPVGVMQNASGANNVYTISNRLKSTQTGSAMCISAGAVGGTDSLQRCTGGIAQKWQSGSLAGFPILISLAHPGNALAATSLTVGARMTLKAASSTNRTENFYWDPLGNAAFVMYAATNHSLVLTPLHQYEGSSIYLQPYRGVVGIQSWHWNPAT
jgi:hypothetical protein